ncbi:DEAD/DEAH box DNA helicase [Aspergillus eucalypticola CBS 122712]|uniref:DNA 3'-5' helicase n=1 Tax=Aspergillus eucalypticola (strain CBS 122712 / IBT 29274) TaxID=1448314 RepID=A0A317UWI7_ASPEC|nr:DEAD/DEAH box DNA helicase [Aspergillus eucalypticola CBS 122712]PWY64887.1 DEAD/DEAH box DNA helicase [Aspergillus eucalypticola CBS 122712]
MRHNTYHSVPQARRNAPYKRWTVPQLPTPSRSNPSAIIDQKLVEGAQEPLFSRLPREDSRSYRPELQLFSRDDDLDLDAFDLELLAQSDEQIQSPQTAASFADRGSLSRPPQRTDYNRVSRFFQAGPHVTPRQSFGSSSSDTGVRSPSSPLIRMRAGRVNAHASEHDFENNIDPHTSSNREILASHSSEISSVARQDRQRGPFQQHLPVSVRGIVLVSVHELPDEYRSIFPFPVFNAVQSKCFQSVYKSDSNIVLAAPTGSGKTAIMELAICRLLNCVKDERFKVIYQAPTKTLCSEKFRDWSRKFNTLGLQCAELTGDTDHTQLRSVQNSQVIITTPEKWDSMTRKWKDHARLMQLVKLFLIDEVHILKEARGATLEAVVSRMKANGSNVRFIALSATVPNSEDIATWLGRDSVNQHVPAHREHFGEDFRPVKLQKFVYGYQSHANDFAFDKMCTSKVADIISSHSRKKPIMIFCCTRNSAVATAKELTRLWTMSNPPARLWKGPGRSMEVQNVDLRATIAAGVAFHHAGLDPIDRRSVETGFLNGQVSIICCTSTLAVGVNLPCHLVIIKGTVGWQEGGCKEYSDLEIMQMLGRAGRPQFDDSATAVIMTRQAREAHYERLVSGSESLESCLHLNLTDHLNAEIGLGNITDTESAIRWLAGTFFFVRMRRNPTYYRLKEDADKEDEEEMLRQICQKDIKLLQDCGLVSADSLKSTKFGDAMARYYVRFETMKTLLTLKPHSTVPQILSVLSRADEFREIRLKAGEKSLYKEINRSNAIRFPSELGAVDLPDGEPFQKHRFTFQQDKTFVFSHINRLIRCIIDCQVGLEDSFTLRNALELARSFGAKVWDDSPLQMKQIEQIGVVAVRKQASSGITSIEALELCEPHQIDMILSRNPPFGRKLLERLVDFPKLRVSVKMIGKETKTGIGAQVNIRSEIAFMNEKCPTYFQRRPVYVCFMAGTSDGRLLDFRRIRQMLNGQEIILSAELKSAGQSVTCYAMCDDIAGTMRSAQLTDLPASLFPSQLDSPSDLVSARPKPNISRRRSNDISQTKSVARNINLWDSDDLLFGDFLENDRAENWSCVDKLQQSPEDKARLSRNTSKGSNRSNNQIIETVEAVRLENGRWACNHRCKDKTTCKHLCCREGLEKPPKANKKRSGDDDKNKGKKITGLNQTTLPATIAKKDTTTQASNPPDFEAQRNLIETPVSTHKPSSGNTNTNRNNNPGSDSGCPVPENILESSSDYGNDSFSDFPSPSALLLGNPIVATSSKEQDPEAPTIEDNTKRDLNTEDWSDDDGWPDFQVPPVTDIVPAPEDGRKRNIQPAQGPDKIDIINSALSEVKEMILNDQNDRPDYHGSTPANSHGRKRKILLTTTVEADRKRCKTDKDIVATYPSSFQPGGTTDVAAEIPAGWEDIEPALLHEFKDVINLL